MNQRKDTKIKKHRCYLKILAIGGGIKPLRDDNKAKQQKRILKSPVSSFLPLPFFRFVYSQQGFQRNHATAVLPIISQTAIVRILGLAPETSSLQQTQQLLRSPLSLSNTGHVWGDEKQEVDGGDAEFGDFGPPPTGETGGGYAPFRDSRTEFNDIPTQQSRRSGTALGIRPSLVYNGGDRSRRRSPVALRSLMSDIKQ